MTTKKYIHSQPRNQPFEEIKQPVGGIKIIDKFI